MLLIGIFDMLQPMKAEKRMSKDAFDAWWDRYGMVYREVEAARERRLARAAERRRSQRPIWDDAVGAPERGRKTTFGLVGPAQSFEIIALALSAVGLNPCDSTGLGRREASRNVARLKSAVRRPSYYAAENERRRKLAAARRQIGRRATCNACPTKEQILDAWIVRRRSHEDAIRFGSLIEDLECYIDNTLRRTEDGVIIGRNPGIKGWLKEHIPALAERYTTVMRYKAAAKKLKQITELRDPVPLNAILPLKPSEREVEQDYGADEDAEKAAAEPSVEVVRARAIWEEVVSGVRGSATALFARIDALLDPGMVEEANMLAGWRERYRNEITVRTKRAWWRRRLWKRSG